MKTILGDNIHLDHRTYQERCNHEADVIVTATVLGFSATRIHLEQPFSFDIETKDPETTLLFERMDNPQFDHDLTMLEGKPADQEKWKKAKQEYIEHLEEMQSFLVVVEAMTQVLNKNHLHSPLIKDAQSPQWDIGERITGRAGGAMVTGPARVKPPADPGGITRGKQEMYQPGGYYGRGAYTGMIDDPVYHNTLVQPTKRIVVPHENRWHKEGGFGQREHGLISPPKNPEMNLSPDPSKGMGPLSSDEESRLRHKGVVGYVHGMSWAIRESIKCGPWCTPYEMAVGKDTTKMASCFPCTTYMYAANYPPSSIHLGRGESWHPLPDTGEAPDYIKIAKALNTRWHLDCYHYLKYGVSLLQTSVNTMDVGHKAAFNRLQKHPRLQNTPQNLAIGGNLFLDALTVHEADWKRIWRTLLPKPEDKHGVASPANACCEKGCGAVYRAGGTTVGTRWHECTFCGKRYCAAHGYLLRRSSHMSRTRICRECGQVTRLIG